MYPTDDGTGLRQLTNKDLIAYVVGQEELSQMELELVLRLEQVMQQREDVIAKVPSLPCANCPAFRHLLPDNLDDTLGDLVGPTEWA